MKLGCRSCLGLVTSLTAYTFHNTYLKPVSPSKYGLIDLVGFLKFLQIHPCSSTRMEFLRRESVGCGCIWINEKNHNNPILQRHVLGKNIRRKSYQFSKSQKIPAISQSFPLSFALSRHVLLCTLVLVSEELMEEGLGSWGRKREKPKIKSRFLEFFLFTIQFINAESLYLIWLRSK